MEIVQKTIRVGDRVFLLPDAGPGSDKEENGPKIASNGEILLEAHALVNGERQSSYGSPAEGFGRVATFWTAYLGHTVTAKDVCICMALLKLAREANRHKSDNLLDAVGYLGLAADAEVV